MGALRFLKVEGLGNDFILVDRRGDREWAAGVAALKELAPTLCDRRRGVGADGVLIVTPGDGDTLAGMIVVNHDGSRPEMCGNGLRCVALHVAVSAGPRSFTVATDAGPRSCVVEAVGGEGRAGVVAVDMGPAIELGSRRPASGSGHVFQAISMGNPHAVALVDGDADPEALARAFGPAVEVDEVFPGRTNVEFVRVEADGTLTLWVWERGCGITDACGTGACAAVAAAVRAGRVAAAGWVRVRLPGGWLEVAVDPGGGVRMRGPARVVFAGSWPS